jgi:hypothetical protein
VRREDHLDGRIISEWILMDEMESSIRLTRDQNRPKGPNFVADDNDFK